MCGVPEMSRDDSTSCTHQVLCALLIHHKTAKVYWLRRCEQTKQSSFINPNSLFAGTVTTVTEDLHGKFVSKINASAIMVMGPDAVKGHPMEHSCMPLETVVFIFFIKTQVAARNLTSFIDTNFILARAGCFPGQQSTILSVCWYHPCPAPSATLFLCLPCASTHYSPTHL